MRDLRSVVAPATRALRARRAARTIPAEVAADLRATAAALPWGREGIPSGPPRVGIVGFTDLPIQAKLHGLFAKTAHLHGRNVAVFTQVTQTTGRAYYELFGLDNLIHWNQALRERGPNDHVAQFVENVGDRMLRVPDLAGIKYKGVQVGKHALSMGCRELVRGHLDLAHEGRAAVAKHLLKAVESVDLAEEVFDRIPIETLIVRDAGYVPNGAIYETALRRGIDCVIYEQGQRKGTWVLRRYRPETLGEHFFSLADPTWQKVKDEPWGPAQDRRVEELFAARYRPDSWEDTRRLMAGRTVTTAQEARAVIGVEPGRRIGIIFAHLAWDAAFFWGECLFDDYDDWLLRTVRFVAEQCPEMDWVVKCHPFNVFKLQREHIAEEAEVTLLRAVDPMPRHVRILRADTPISTSALFDIADAVVTVHGTIGMEFPCFGVPALVAGAGRYDRRGFTLDPSSLDEYFSMLLDLQAQPRLDPRERTLARRYFLALMERRQFSFEDVATMELRRLNEGQSDVHDNLRMTAPSLGAFAEAPSIRRFGEWLLESDAPDLLALERDDITA